MLYFVSAESTDTAITYR